MTSEAIATKNGEQLARPLKVLVPLIKDDLRQADEAANQAGMPYYISAGEKLLEAKATNDKDVRPMNWVTWLNTNFHLSQTTAYRYMAAAKKTARGKVTFTTVSEAYEPRRHPGHRPDWIPPVHDVLKQVRTAALNLRQRDISLTKERDLERRLALKLIDIGYKVLSVELHPDKGGSHDAMSRLNRVRSRLKSAA